MSSKGSRLRSGETKRIRRPSWVLPIANATGTKVSLAAAFRLNITKAFLISYWFDMSQCMRFPTMWYVRPAKPQTSLRVRAVWSEPLQVDWIFYEYIITDQASFGVSKLRRRLYRLSWVYTCQNATLLEITWHGSYVNVIRWLTITVCFRENMKVHFPLKDAKNG